MSSWSVGWEKWIYGCVCGSGSAFVDVFACVVAVFLGTCCFFFFFCGVLVGIMFQSWIVSLMYQAVSSSFLFN